MVKVLHDLSHDRSCIGRWVRAQQTQFEHDGYLIRVEFTSESRIYCVEDGTIVVVLKHPLDQQYPVVLLIDEDWPSSTRDL